MVKEGTNWLRFTAATLIAILLAAILIPIFHLTALVMLLGVWIAIVIIAAYLRRKFSGLTGDTYGAINEITEVSALIIVIVLARLGLA